MVVPTVNVGLHDAKFKSGVQSWTHFANESQNTYSRKSLLLLYYKKVFKKKWNTYLS